MFHYESGRPELPGASDGIAVQLDTREIRRWNENDWEKREEAELHALEYGLQKKKTQYFIYGAGQNLLDHGLVASLKQKYPEHTARFNELYEALSDPTTSVA
jgi:hypothetical protein